MSRMTESLYRRLMGQGERRKLPPGTAGFVLWLAMGTAVYNLWAVFAYPEAVLHRGLNFGLFFALIFLLHTTPGGRSRERVPWWDWLLAALAAAVSLYIWANLERFVTRFPFVEPLLPADVFFGLLAVVLLLEGTRRLTGPWLSLLCVCAVVYALIGRHIPGLFGHGGFSLQSIVDELFMTTDGIWGSVLGMATTYITVFVIFGSFLQHSGAVKTSITCARSMRRWRISLPPNSPGTSGFPSIKALWIFTRK